MTEEIRPNYYKSASQKYRPVLTALGFHPNHFDMECVDAWKCLGLHYCAPATHAVKYLWRCGEKDDEAQELKKALFWLNRALAQVDENYLKQEPFNCYLRKIWPHPEEFEDAISRATQLLGELNGPKA